MRARRLLVPSVLALAVGIVVSAQGVALAGSYDPLLRTRVLAMLTELGIISGGVYTPAASSSLAAVLAVGADANSVPITGLTTLTGVSASQLKVQGYDGGAGASGVAARIRGGYGDDLGSAPGEIFCGPGGPGGLLGAVEIAGDTALVGSLSVTATTTTVGLTATGNTTLGNATGDHCTITGDLALASASVGTAGQSIASAGASAACVWTGTVVGQAGLGTGGVVTVTNSLTLDASYAGKVIVVTGANATVTITLPTAAASAGPFTVVDLDAAQTVRIAASSGDNIKILTLTCNTAGYWSSNTVTNMQSINLMCLDSTSWWGFATGGSWISDTDTP